MSFKSVFFDFEARALLRFGPCSFVPGALAQAAMPPEAWPLVPEADARFLYGWRAAAPDALARLLADARCWLRFTALLVALAARAGFLGTSEERLVKELALRERAFSFDAARACGCSANSCRARLSTAAAESKAALE